VFKIIMFVKKRPELGTEEFLACWREHSAKVLRYQAALGIRAYTKTLPEAADTMRDTLPFAYDAMGELWYDSRDDFLRARSTPAGQAALAELRVDELRFVDMAQSVMWFGTEERVI
jgi:ethyl tert-butyl ether degradation ethD